jgi:hypothetical protein
MRILGLGAFRLLIGGCAVGALAGCSPGLPFDNEFTQYSQRIFTVTPGAGNAVAANEAIQTIYPWPRYAYNTRIPANGAKMTAAVAGYEGGGGSASSGSPTTVNINSGSGPMVSGAH